MSEMNTRRSNWWFLLPVFLNILGGVIAYFVLRGDDPSKAKNCLYLGIALLIIPGITSFAFMGMDMGMPMMDDMP